MNLQRFLAYIKRQIKKVATFLISRDVVTFCLFFLFAFILWFSYSLDSQREANINIPIKYIGIPENIQFEKNLPNNLLFTIKDKGKTIWSYHKLLSDTLEIDLTNQFNETNTLEIKYKEYIKKILPQLSSTTNIIELSPSYFTINYARMHSKSVPIVTSNAIKLAPQHTMYDTISISPKYITILGTKEAIDTISYLYLAPILEEINKTKTLSIKIQTPKGVKINQKSANVTIPVEMCTEKEVTVPVIVENAPKNISVRTFPSEIKIKFSVGLSHYTSATEKTFCASIDYNDIIADSEQTTATIQLDYTSGYIFNIKLNPSKVEFIIEK